MYIESENYLENMILNIIVVIKEKTLRDLDLCFLALVLEASNYSPESFMNQSNTSSTG